MIRSFSLQMYSSNGEPEDKSVLLGGRTRDMTQPLQEQERSRFSVAGFIWWILMMHYPIPPSGQRHHGMPPSGMMARGRILVRLLPSALLTSYILCYMQQ